VPLRLQSFRSLLERRALPSSERTHFQSGTFR
jgi:hypothetical protein